MASRDRIRSYVIGRRIAEAAAAAAEPGLAGSPSARGFDAAAAADTERVIGRRCTGGGTGGG